MFNTFTAFVSITVKFTEKSATYGLELRPQSHLTRHRFKTKHHV